jgi:hypothetical protein
LHLVERVDNAYFPFLTVQPVRGRQRERSGKRLSRYFRRDLPLVNGIADNPAHIGVSQRGGARIESEKLQRRCIVIARFVHTGEHSFMSPGRVGPQKAQLPVAEQL